MYATYGQKVFALKFTHLDLTGDGLGENPQSLQAKIKLGKPSSRSFIMIESGFTMVKDWIESC